jgi:hypothetical protein
LAAITQSYRILVIDGRSRWETRYLRNAFQRDSQWKIETLIVGPGTDDLTLPRGETEGTFPTDRERLFAYDLIVFGEVVPEVFADHELVWIREFVELRGGGLLLLDGQRNMLSSYPENFTELFPISWNGDVIQVLPDRLRLTERGANEAAFRLAVDKAENRSSIRHLTRPGDGDTRSPTPTTSDFGINWPKRSWPDHSLSVTNLLPSTQEPPVIPTARWPTSASD